MTNTIVAIPRKLPKKSVERGLNSRVSPTSLGDGMKLNGLEPLARASKRLGSANCNNVPWQSFSGTIRSFGSCMKTGRGARSCRPQADGLLDPQALNQPLLQTLEREPPWLVMGLSSICGGRGSARATIIMLILLGETLSESGHCQPCWEVDPRQRDGTPYSSSAEENNPSPTACSATN
jgi:hypothetical protein